MFTESPAFARDRGADRQGRRSVRCGFPPLKDQADA
jgi:hypothetical protein